MDAICIANVDITKIVVLVAMVHATVVNLLKYLLFTQKQKKTQNLFYL